ncbi:MAG TPA: acetyl-CoA carboxylase biotin carboxyl carrier protein [Clostridia bacterium]|nr:acetyl-CoA carboxylase biotin carboxyl carrier protein [Clostridia bacterium]
MTKPVKLTDTTLRDAHQSLWATRMRVKDMLPVLEMLDNAGYHSLEVWGGATFDVCMRYLEEDPWERLRLIRQRVRQTSLQMLLRGQSLVGYQHYPDDVVQSFIGKAVANGIDIIRIFDALNDLRNMEVPIEAAKKEGAHVQGTVVYTISPVHTIEHYFQTALQLEQMGVDSICIKDMAGLLAPFQAYELVHLFKKKLQVPIQLHSHYIGGLAIGTYLMAAQAGVDVVDTASVPLAFGASQPPVETLVRALSGTPYDTGLDISQLFEMAKYFEDLRQKLGFERGVTRISDMWVFEHQVPGGMITNLVSQLKEQKAAHRLPEVLAEIPRVREELGYPPLVTPTSQIVGTQAVLNVLTGSRYKLVPGEVKSYIKGSYGRPPGPIAPALMEKIIGNEQVIDQRPADLLEPRLEEAKKEIEGLARNEEDVISYCLFPQVALKFFQNRENKVASPVEAHQPEIETGGTRGTSLLEGGQSKVNISEIKELIEILDASGLSELKLETGSVKLALKRHNGGSQETAELSPPVATNQINGTILPQNREDFVGGKTHVIKSPMVGTFYRAPSPDAPPFVELDSRISKGQTMCIIEAMKLMNEIEAEVTGRVVKILVENGGSVEYGQELFLIEEE